MVDSDTAYIIVTFEMASELARYKSMLDDSASTPSPYPDYNRTALFEAQKAAFRPEIAFSDRMNQHN